MKRHTDIPCDAELVEGIVRTHSVVDVASGIVVLTYESESEGIRLYARVPYDTSAGPDGLFTHIDTELGEWINGEGKKLDEDALVEYSYPNILVTSKVLDDAKAVFSEYKPQAVMSAGSYTVESEDINHEEN
ncbi:hypothetical protein [Methanohalobium sp.]|uniref:hypothetical protein n=1 Tax=Methanohalobium sp. TaxID=2837493 RepID=UPI0025FBB00F|nr:hypothetical protein [Methanohalobium sp.]